jgi:hypothetical protein
MKLNPTDFSTRWSVMLFVADLLDAAVALNESNAATITRTAVIETILFTTTLLCYVRATVRR